MDDSVIRRNRGPSRPVVTFVAGDFDPGEGRPGPLRMTVEFVAWSQPQQRSDGPWFRVRGMQLAPDGRELGVRDVLVRGSRLPGRPPNTRL